MSRPGNAIRHDALGTGVTAVTHPSANQGTASPPPTDVPVAVLESLLRDHLADPAAVITECASTPFLHHGTNDSTTFHRVSLTWTSPGRGAGPRATTWIVKHWRAGGGRDGAAGITQSREVLAWEQGWLRPAALPPGVVVPVIAARCSVDAAEAWLAMTDVSAELAAYPRLGLTGEQALVRARAILARLACLHAWWEQPDRQAALRAAPWLGRPEVALWASARASALALGRTPVAPPPAVAAGPPAWAGLAADLAADLAAFLVERPPSERWRWEELLIDCQPLVDGLAPYPRTLLHGDLDDRNIGLRWPGDREPEATPDAPDLVLIDWEWMALGPAMLDVAKIIQMLPVVIAPGAPIPEACWTDDLAAEYVAHYRAAGGRSAEAGDWRRAYGLACIAHGLTQLPASHGRMLRALHGESPPPPVAGVPAAVVRQLLQTSLPPMERAADLIIREAHRWLG